VLLGLSSVLLIEKNKAFGDQLGNAVAVDGNTLVAGARQKNSSTGAAYVFRRATNGAWSQEAKLTGTGTVAQDQFGCSVGLDGNLVVVGAPDPFDLFGSASGPGRAFVRRSARPDAGGDLTAVTGPRPTSRCSAALAIDRPRRRQRRPGQRRGHYTAAGAACVFRNDRRPGRRKPSVAPTPPSAICRPRLNRPDGHRPGRRRCAKDGTGTDSGAVYLFRPRARPGPRRPS
jgi:hypothetical protein